jgi:iron complex outermembrane receptor protein
VSDADLKNKTTYNLVELGEKLPNVVAGGSYSASFTIRGITSGTSGSGFAPAMGVNVDEVFMARDRSFDTGVADVERIEVLRGPQGTLYGKNTIAGTINITSKRPTNEFEVLGDVRWGNKELVEARATVSGPIIEDKLLIRINGFTRDRDGFIQNTVTGTELNDTNNYGGRVMLVANLVDNLTIEFRGDTYTQDENSGSLETFRTIRSGAPPLPVFAGPPFNTVPPQNGTDRVVNHDTDAFQYREVKGLSAKVEYDWDGYLFTWIGAYREQESDQNSDNDGGPLFGFNTGRAEGVERTSNELRITSPDDGPFSWIVGAYFDDETDTNLYHIDTGPGFPSPLLGLPLLPADYREQSETRNQIDSESWSVFASGAWDITDALTVQGGLRYTSETKHLFYTQGPTIIYPVAPFSGLVGLFAFPFTLLFPNGFTNDYEDDAISGDVSVSYAFEDDVIGYFRYAHGYKAGGFQSDVISPQPPPAPPVPSTNLVFDPETLDAYEAGLKAEWFDAELTTNIAVFFYDFKNKQEQVNTGVSFRVDGADAESQGIELELGWFPTDGLSFFANVGYLEATYTDFRFCGGLLTDCTGNDLANASPWSTSVGGTYVVPTGWTDVNFYVSADADYRAAYFTDVQNSALLKLDSYTIVNGRIGFESDEGRWGIYAWGRNIFDETVVGGGVAVLNNFYVARSINFGQSYGLELRYHLW